MEYELLAEFTVAGQPPRKSNQRMVVSRGRGPKAKPMVIKSKEARTYVGHFILSVPGEYRDMVHGSLEEDLRLDIIVWYTSRRPDLSVELIKDCIEAAGVIKNDRYVREEHLYGFVDKENPRTMIRLYRIVSDREIPF